MTNSKHFFKSKTFWFNLLVGILPAILQNLTGQGVIDPQTQTTALTVGNVALRFITNTQIK